MKLKEVWRPRICRLVLRSWEFGGRRDRQGPEEAGCGKKDIQVQGRRIIDMTIDSYFLISDLDVFQKR
jgi:hypothetical protein